MTCTCASCPVHRRSAGWWPAKMPALAMALLLANCGGIVERDPKPVACWMQCSPDECRLLPEQEPFAPSEWDLRKGPLTLTPIQCETEEH